MASPPPSPHPLDNPVWHSLGGGLAHLADTAADAPARRFRADVSPFGAVDVLDEAGWAAMARLVGEGGAAIFFRDHVPAAPSGWTETFRIRGLQFVADDIPPPPPLELEPLGEKDADEMVALTQLTEPGPFLRHTHEMGGYLGHRREGRLVAMAGRRFQVPGYREVSAVCTHPDVRREGLGAAITLSVAHAIREGGEEACLHVASDNHKAIALYRKLGFVQRREIDVVVAVYGDAPDAVDAPHS